MKFWHSPAWLAASIRHKLLAMALLPLAVVFPLLVLALTLWSNIAYDRLLITKVRADLAVAQGYFAQVLGEVGSGTLGVAASHALVSALQQHQAPDALLAQERRRLRLDFLNFYPADPLAGQALPPALAATLVALPADAPSYAQARLVLLPSQSMREIAPDVGERLQIPLLPTRNAAPSQRAAEDRAMVMVSTLPVRDAAGGLLGVLSGGLLLNQNLDFIDHINRIVYPEGSLPFGSQGTATLFLDDVRITTNVRLFQDQRAVGTRVSQSVRQAVLGEGQTWLDRAFVVNDWYVSAYEPLLDADDNRIGMLYVGYLEKPFRWVRYGMVAAMGLIFLAVMAAAAMFSVRWARSIFKPVEQMNQTMRRVEGGEAAARVGPVVARDELGALAAHLDELLDTIDEKTRALQDWASELDHKVADRTRELAASNASLRQAHQQLVKSEKLAAIGQLTASIAHEINNPIAVMQGNLDLMRDTLGPQAEPVRAEIDLLDAQIERMRLIVTQLLQYARPTEYAGYVEMLDTRHTLDACLVLVAHLLQQRRISVTRNCNATQRVGFNPQELQQVVINLLINAIQAMPDGGELRLLTRDWLDDNGHAQGATLTIQDSGPGLSDAVRGHLFSPFYTTKNDGNGLGLWISQGLVDRYGGKLEADNRSDAPGAEFRIRLLTEPLAPAEAQASTRDGRPGGG